MSAFHRVVTKAIEANKTSESLQETEEKFATLSLAFKTDRQTLDKRLELHLRARDVAESNIQKELQAVKDGLKALGRSCKNQDALANTQHHLDVLEQSIARMSSQAELHGAVQQEMRVSQAVDVMILHVENLKRTNQKEHAELEDARKQMQHSRHGSSAEHSDNDGAGSRSHAGGHSFSKVNRRRASIAVISKAPLLQTRSSSVIGSSAEEGSTGPGVNRNPSLESLLFAEQSTKPFGSATSSRISVRSSRPLVRHCSSSVLEASPSMSLSRNNNNHMVNGNASNNNNNNNALVTSKSADDAKNTDDDDGDITAEWAAFKRRQEGRGGSASTTPPTAGSDDTESPASDRGKESPLPLTPPSTTVPGPAGLVRKPARLNASAISLARVVERVEDEEKDDEEKQEPEVFDDGGDDSDTVQRQLKAARRRLTLILSRSQSTIKENEPRIKRALISIRIFVLAVLRVVAQHSVIARRLSELTVPQVAPVAAVAFGLLSLVVVVWLCASRLTIRFASSVDQ